MNQRLTRFIEQKACEEAMEKHAQGILGAAAAASPLLVLAHPVLRFLDILSQRKGAFPRKTPAWSTWGHLNRYGLKLR